MHCWIAGVFFSSWLAALWSSRFAWRVVSKNFTLEDWKPLQVGVDLIRDFRVHFGGFPGFPFLISLEKVLSRPPCHEGVPSSTWKGSMKAWRGVIRGMAGQRQARDYRGHPPACFLIYVWHP
jgi:hypothetical protein